MYRITLKTKFIIILLLYINLYVFIKLLFRTRKYAIYWKIITRYESEYISKAKFIFRFWRIIRNNKNANLNNNEYISYVSYTIYSLYQYTIQVIYHQPCLSLFCPYIMILFKFCIFCKFSNTLWNNKDHIIFK